MALFIKVVFLVLLTHPPVFSRRLNPKRLKLEKQYSVKSPTVERYSQHDVAKEAIKQYEEEKALEATLASNSAPLSNSMVQTQSDQVQVDMHKGTSLAETSEAATAKAAEAPADIPASALAQTDVVSGGPLLPAMAAMAFTLPVTRLGRPLSGAAKSAGIAIERRRVSVLKDAGDHTNQMVGKHYDLQRVSGLKMSAVEEGKSTGNSFEENLQRFLERSQGSLDKSQGSSSDRRHEEFSEAVTESRDAVALWRKQAPWQSDKRGKVARWLHLAPDLMAATKDLDRTESRLRKARKESTDSESHYFDKASAALEAAKARMIESQAAINAVQSDSAQPADAVEAALVAVEAAEEKTQAAMNTALGAMSDLRRSSPLGVEGLAFCTCCFAFHLACLAFLASL